MRLIAALGIVIAAAGLVATNVFLYNMRVDISALAPAKKTGVKVPAGADPSEGMPDLGGFAETFERPLFSPSRRKFVPAPVDAEPVAPASAPVDPQPQAQQVAASVAAPSLLGISISGGTARALLQAEGGAAAEWYANGETVNGWTVSAIDKQEAVLTRDGREARLSLYPPMQKPADGGSSIAQ